MGIARPARAEPDASPDVVAGAPRPPALAPRAPVPRTDPWRPLRFTSGVSLTGIGALSLITSGVLLGRAVVDKSEIGSHCNAAKKCDLIGYTLASEAEDFALTSTVMFVVGIAATAVGVPLLVSGRPQTERASGRLVRENTRAARAITPTIGFSTKGIGLGLLW